MRTAVPGPPTLPVPNALCNRHGLVAAALDRSNAIAAANARYWSIARASPALAVGADAETRMCAEPLRVQSVRQWMRGEELPQWTRECRCVELGEVVVGVRQLDVVRTRHDRRDATTAPAVG